ncbi:MAG: alcohol dehydrogenase catalytic domain-containing protein [Planctomycetes bacterium]|nr:alcohol dehydrogenase catalytic domain-containing protein [Planctomycetota bacterium]
MSTKTDRYKRLEGGVPERTLVWQLSGKGFESFRLEEIPVPRMGPRDILFRSDTNGICASDVKIINQGGEHARLKRYDVARQKVVPGHEASITVVKVGPEADRRLKPGDRCIVQADMLEHDSAVGYDVWGAMIQYGVFDERVQRYLIKVEEDIGYSQASLVEPWACIEASYERADLQLGDEVVWVIGGGGPMGQMHALRALSKKRLGRLPAFHTLLVTDVSEERLAAVRSRFEARASEAGVRLVTLDPTRGGFDERMAAIAPKGAAYVIACAPSPEVVLASAKHIRRYGVLNLFAGIKRGTGQVFLGDIHYDQITVTGNSGSRLEDMEKMLRITERGELDTNFSAGAVVGMRACAEGVKAVAEGRITNKTILYPQLPDLPLTRIEDLQDRVRFSPEVAAEVRAGKWSKRAEEEMLEALLPAPPGGGA